MMKVSKNSRVNLLFKAYGYILYLTRLKKTQGWSADQFRKYQYENVRKTLLEARNVPYYRDLFNRIGFDPGRDFMKLEDIEKIPLLTKDIIRKEYANLVNPRYKGIAVEYATSGSTGEPQKMLITPYMVAMDKAMIFRHHGWAVNKLRPTIFSLRSYVASKPGDPLFKYNFAENSYYFSAYNLNHENAGFYREKLLEINPDILRGYPSSISFLCDYLGPEDVSRLTHLKGIYTSSETLTCDERTKIESLFGKRLFNWYGMTEPAIIIKEGPDHDGMHMCLEYGYPELMQSETEGARRLVTTSFHNSVMPFIRYDTGDLVDMAGPVPGASGIRLPKVNTVLGRKDDYITALNGGKLPSINFYTLFREFSAIRAFQIIQFSTLEILVLIRTSGKLSTVESEKLMNGLKLRIGNGIDIYIEEREKFFTNADGKTLVILKKPGSYKLSRYDAYSLSTQKAWANYRNDKNCYKLDWNEADEVADQDVLDFIKNKYDKDNYLKWYPEANHSSLLEKIRDINGMDSTDKILLSHGSDNALRMVLQVFTSRSKCMVLFPTYDNFRAQAEAFGNSVHGITVSDAGDENMEKVLQEMDRLQPRLIYITNPNNPIGYQVGNEWIAKILRRAASMNSLVILDEAYHEFSGETALPLLKEHRNLLLVRTFSKAYGLAGLRLGYIISNEEIIEELRKVYNPKDVTMISVAVGEYMMNNYDKVREYVKIVNRNKEDFYKYCRDNRIRFYESKGNFVSYEVDSVNKYLSFMNDNEIFIRDRRGYFDGEFVRITIGADKSYHAFLAADRAYRQLS